MCKAAGLPVRANSSKKWLAMPELREVLLADLFPEAEKAGKWFDGKLQKQYVQLERRPISTTEHVSVIVKTTVYINISFAQTEGVISICHEILNRFVFGMSGGVLKLFMGLVVGQILVHFEV